MGISFKLPPGIGGGLSEVAVRWMLALAFERFEIVEAVEALPFTTARYFGLRLELRK